MEIIEWGYQGGWGGALLYINYIVKKCSDSATILIEACAKFAINIPIKRSNNTTIYF
jgi:hypothetical protein